MEEAGLAYDLVRLPFPPRQVARDYLDVNPLGTVPALLVDGTLMTESAAMCQLIGERATDASLRVAPSKTDYPFYVDWLHRSDATLTFPLTLVLRYSRMETQERLAPQVVADYRHWFLKPADAVERRLVDADHLCADRFTMADVAVGYALYLATKLGLGPDLGPLSRRYVERHVRRPALVRQI